MIISEARNLLEMRKTESSATHKSLRKAQAKTAQANAKAARLGALVTSLNSRYGRGARAAVDRVEQRRRYDLDQDMATLKVGDEVELFWTTIQLILIGSELRDPSASGEWHTAKIIKVNAAGGGLLFDVQYDDAEESQEKKVRLHSNKSSVAGLCSAMTTVRWMPSPSFSARSTDGSVAIMNFPLGAVPYEARSSEQSAQSFQSPPAESRSAHREAPW